MSEIVTTERREDCLIIRVNNPPVNALGHAVRAGIVDALQETGDAKYAVLHCEGRTFFAGADITEFGKSPLAPSLADMIAALEDCPIPVIAAIHGMALGGGLETALGCDDRIIDRKARIGFPEIDLGIFPGAGGTQRAPRLTGMAATLSMILDGKHVDAARAVDIGLCDEISDGDLLENAIAFARQQTQNGFGERAFAAARFAQHDDGFFVAQAEVDAIHRFDDAFAGAKVQGEIFQSK